MEIQEEKAKIWKLETARLEMEVGDKEGDGGWQWE